MEPCSECYICYETATKEATFIQAGCACRGTLNIHKDCFKQLGKTVCPVCQLPFSHEATTLLVRKQIEYDENGKLSSEIGYLFDTDTENDVYHGEAKYFFEDGKLWIWCNYNKDRLCGFFRIYDKSGRLSKESWYR